MDAAIERYAEAARNRLADPTDEVFTRERPAERVWQANSAEILPADDGGFIVVLRLWDQTATCVARAPGELRALLDRVEWKRTETTAHQVPRLRTRLSAPGAVEGAGGAASAPPSR